MRAWQTTSTQIAWGLDCIDPAYGRPAPSRQRRAREWAAGRLVSWSLRTALRIAPPRAGTAVRAVLKAAAGEIEPRPGGLDRIRARTRDGR